MVRPRRAGAILIIFGVMFEAVGFIMRALSSQVDPYLLPYFMCQYFFIVVALVFFAAAIYLALSWLLLGVSGRHKPPVSPRLILIIFVCFDIVCTIIQVAGAASIGTAESNDQDPSPANDVLIMGLAIQVAAFLDFLVVSWILVDSGVCAAEHQLQAKGS
ncbi:hypothetical protein WJX84_010654 [Apatococcus fuscideae]|uniref:MARVEL domain-containing protein n=1 Tax=Apatococcus fuscideae TaxID=2026836 RepID=A0AAW1TCM4_9CHLO